MNKLLQQKVKDKCKDMGLSEVFVTGITERMGATLTDDSTEEQIEQVANQIMEVAKLSQGEATRWVDKNNKKNPPAPKKEEPSVPEPPEHPAPTPAPTDNEPEWFKKYREQQETRIKQLEEQNKAITAEKAKEARAAMVNTAFAKHKIPESLRDKFIVPDSVEADKIDGYVGEIAQTLVTLQLPELAKNAKPGTTQLTTEEAKAMAEKMLPGFGSKKE